MSPPSPKLNRISCNGRSYCGHSSFIGLLPALDECISHITRPYLKKLKHYLRVALAGSRIFIRVMQQVNTWGHKRHLCARGALVPAS
jgi:hypothetical protein